MRKFFTLLAAALCSITSFAQDIQLETKDGQVIENGSTVVIKGEMVDMMIWGEVKAGIYVRNLTSTAQGVFAQMNVVSGVETQICWGGSCVGVPVGNSYTTNIGRLDADTIGDLQVKSLTMGDFKNVIATSTIELIVWTNDKPEEKISATITFYNEETLLSIENLEVNAHAVYAKDNVLYYNFANEANRQLQVYNVAGNLCQNIRLTSEAGSINLEGMTKGIYLYRVVEGGKKGVSGKLLVK